MATPFQAASWYARHMQWPVFPVHTPHEKRCSCGNAGCASQGKHPRIAHGVLEATTHLGQVAQWWQAWPDANIGIATGPLSGLVVLDVDDGGADTLAQLTAEHGPLPDTVEQITGSGGRHLLFQHPGKPVTNKARIAPGLDIRADGGYIIVPPSLHVSGRRYEWEASSKPGKQAIAPIPPWLLTLVNGGAPRVQAAEIAKLEKIPNGQRDSTLTRMAGAMRRYGCCEEAILAALTVENEKRCDPPLPLADVTRIAHSVARYTPETQPVIGMAL